jgi:hypothetical protein
LSKGFVVWELKLAWSEQQQHSDLHSQQQFLEAFDAPVGDDGMYM